MEKTVNPKVKLLAQGNAYVAKQMQAKAGDLLPLHLADMESILFVQEGSCLFKMLGEDKTLQAGDSLVIPEGVKHQIKAITSFKALHFMPKEINFTFF